MRQLTGSHKNFERAHSKTVGTVGSQDSRLTDESLLETAARTTHRVGYWGYITDFCSVFFMCAVHGNGKEPTEDNGSDKSDRQRCQRCKFVRFN